MKFLLMTMLFLSAVLMPGLSNAQANKAEMREMLEFTAAAYGYEHLCLLMIDGPGSYFRTNYKILQDEFELIMMNEDPELSLREAEIEVNFIIQEVTRDVRALVDTVGCDGEEREMFADHFRTVATTPPDEFISRLIGTTQQEPLTNESGQGDRSR